MTLDSGPQRASSQVLSLHRGVSQRTRTTRNADWTDWSNNGDLTTNRSGGVYQQKWGEVLNDNNGHRYKEREEREKERERESEPLIWEKNVHMGKGITRLWLKTSGRDLNHLQRIRWNRTPAMTSDEMPWLNPATCTIGFNGKCSSMSIRTIHPGFLSTSNPPSPGFHEVLNQSLRC